MRTWQLTPAPKRGEMLYRLGALIASKKEMLAQAATRALQVAESRYKAGATSYLQVVDSQRTLLVVQRLDVQFRGAREMPSAMTPTPRASSTSGPATPEPPGGPGGRWPDGRSPSPLP